MMVHFVERGASCFEISKHLHELLVRLLRFTKHSKRGSVDQLRMLPSIKHLRLRLDRLRLEGSCHLRGRRCLFLCIKCLVSHLWLHLHRMSKKRIKLYLHLGLLLPGLDLRDLLLVCRDCFDGSARSLYTWCTCTQNWRLEPQGYKHTNTITNCLDFLLVTSRSSHHFIRTICPLALVPIEQRQPWLDSDRIA